jgi:hypothetical protein
MKPKKKARKNTKRSSMPTKGETGQVRPLPEGFTDMTQADAGKGFILMGGIVEALMRAQHPKKK